ncbi:MAG TPA: calcium-binding protein, partial [Vineibacter sp.]|nr:calcium-binding protein [Vineibacter sp.]
SAADADFGTLRVWRDLDGDGVTDAGELKSLAESGITEIALASTTPSTGMVRGNAIRAESTFTRADGSTSKIGDVLLETFEADSRYLGDTTVSAEAAALPELKGYGTLTDLRVAMTDDAALLAMVDAIKALPAGTSWADLRDAADDVLLRWAGVDGIAATPFAAGTFDTQRLAFLEKYTGQTLVPRDAQGQPMAINASELIAAWADILDRATIRLAAQGPWAARFAGASFDKAADTFQSASATTLADIYGAHLAALPADPAMAATQWAGSAGPALAAFNNSLLRADQNAVRADWAVHSLVRATTLTPSALTLAQLIAGLALEGVQIGTANAETLTRLADGPGTQVYVGGAGNDRLVGGAGQDVFVFGPGFGHDRIADSEYAQSGDRVRLATLNPADVRIARSGNDLVITVIATGETITVEGQYAAPTVVPPWLMGAQPGFGIEDIQFADGTIWEAGLIALEIGKGTDGNDTLIGTSREDALRGLLGNDTVRGGDSGDLYFYWLGDGQDVIEDTRTDINATGGDALFLLGGLMADNVTPSRVGKSADIKLSFSDGGSVTLKNQAAYTPIGYGGLDLDSRIETIFFTDGPTWSWLELQQQVIDAYTTDGADTTYGFGTPDELYSSPGDDYLSGLDGNDTYHVERGTGADTIDDASLYVETPFSAVVGSLGPQEDTLAFGAGITAADVTFSRTGAAPDLLITIADSTDSVRVVKQFDGIKLDLLDLLGMAWFGRIERFSFADGTSKTWEDVLRLVTTGGDGDDSLYGAYHPDLLDGKAGDDYLSGGDHGDTYLFGRGYGQDVIEDRQTSVLTTASDTVKFNADVAVGDVTFARDGSTKDLLISISGAPDTLRIKNQYDVVETGVFGAHGFNRIERFEWADGTVKVWSGLTQQIIDASRTAGDDLIVGTHGDDVLDGGAGNDRLEGGNGSDTYVFDRGHGGDVVADWLDSVFAGDTDRVAFGSQILPSDLVLERTGADLQHLRLTVAGTGDSLLVEGQFSTTAIAYTPTRIESFAFTNGVTWSAAELQRQYVLQRQTAGDDTIEGFAASDTIEGGTGNDVLRGRGGNDTYRFEAGFGQDRIEENNGGGAVADDDVLVLGAGFSAAGTSLTRVGSDLVIGFSGSTDSITVAGQFASAAWYGSGTDVERVTFQDGTSWSDVDIRLRLLQQARTAGDDVMAGFFTADVLDGGAGNDVLRGSSGGDTYVFDRDHGQDVIEESLDDHPFTDGPDTVSFGPGILPSQISFARVGNDLVASLAGTSDTLTIRNHFTGASSKVEFFRFADGSTVTSAQAEAGSVAAQSTAGNDTITGTGAADFIDGGAGNDILRGGDGADIYLVSVGFGQDSIEENYSAADTGNIDTLVFGAGIARDSIQLSRTPGLRDLIITVAGSSDSVTIKGQFSSAAWYGSWTDIERFVFADGSSLTDPEIRARLVAQSQTGGNDVIHGFFGDDVIDGGAGNDELRGSSGSDTYRFGRGDGQDSVYESLDDHPFLEGSDTVAFEEGIGRPDVAFTRTGNDLIATIVGTTDAIRIVNHYGWVYATMETFRFADGTSLSRAEVERAVIDAQATSGDDVIIGTGSADSFHGSAGNDILRGGDGADTYLLGPGFGQDRIEDNASAEDNSNFDTLTFGVGIDPEDVVIGRAANPNDLVLSIAGTNDQVTVAGQFSSSAWYGSWADVERVTFANGTVWTDADLRRALLAQARTDGDDTIHGYYSDDILDGGKGNDTLRGSSGGDAYLFDRGHGQDVIVESVDHHPFLDKPDTVRFGPAIPEADLRFAREGADLVIRIAGTTDSLRVVGQFGGGTSTVVESFELSTGRVITATEMHQLVVDGAVTVGDDTIVGYTGAETFDAIAGNDTLKGGGGDDTYVYGPGYGIDVIEDDGASAGDTVRFKAGIAPSSITWTASGNDAVAQFAGAAGDRLTIRNQLEPVASPQDRIESFVFADGTTLSHQDLVALLANGEATPGVTIAGTPGIDTLNGTAGNDVFGGGRGADLINTSAGSDTFIWKKGDGNDWINEEAASTTETDSLRLLDVLPGDVHVKRSGLDLFVDIVPTGERIEVDEQYKSTTQNYGIERLEFADGSFWDRARIQQDAWILGTAGNDVLDASTSAFNDTFEGAGGDDTLRSGWRYPSGSDTFAYRRGDGNDIVDDWTWAGNNETDTLWLRDINPADVVLSRVGTELLVKDSTTGQVIRVLYQFVDPAAAPGVGIEKIRFADGTEWDRVRIQQDAVIRGTPGNDVLDVTTSTFNDTFDGGTGDDTIKSGWRYPSGSDTYIYRRGDGNDVIDEWTWAGNNETDVLWLRDLNSSDVVLSRTGTELQVKDTVTGHVTRVLYQFVDSPTAPGVGIEKIRFADGTEWDRARITIEAPYQGTAAAETLNDTVLSDTIVPAGGNDTVNANGGSDTVVYASGDGSDFLNEEGTNNADVDVIRLVGLNPADIELSRTGDDVKIKIKADGAVIENDQF